MQNVSIADWSTESFNLADSDAQIYFLGVDGDEATKFSATEGTQQPSSATMWKVDTSKSVKEEDGLLRLYFQRTTPSVAEIGLGETTNVGVKFI